ncbi:MAG: hypothetical protein DRN99_03255, partial [Thermoproteota archaeon]
CWLVILKYDMVTPITLSDMGVLLGMRSRLIAAACLVGCVLAALGYAVVVQRSRRGGGGAPTPAATAASGFPVAVMDSAGRTVSFSKPPERVIVLYGYWAEVLYCLGVGDRIVGVGKDVRKVELLPEYIREKPSVGSVWRGLSWEAVLNLSPDLLVMGLWWGSFEPKEAEIVKKAGELGIPVLALGIPDSSKTGTRMPYENIRIIRVLGEVFGRREKAEELAKFLEEYYSRALEIAKKIPEGERKRVLVVYGSSIAGKYATGAISISYRGSAYAEAVELVNAHNVAFDYNFTTQYPKLDLEKLIAYFGEKTDILIVVDWDEERLSAAVEKVKSDPRWHEIKAVREGRVVGLLVASWKKGGAVLYGPRFVTGIYAFGHAIYPEYYPDWKPIYEEIIQRFYVGG